MAANSVTSPHALGQFKMTAERKGVGLSWEDIGVQFVFSRATLKCLAKRA